MQYDAYCIKHIFVLRMGYYNMPLSLVHVWFQTLNQSYVPNINTTKIMKQHYIQKFFTCMKIQCTKKYDYGFKKKW